MPPIALAVVPYTPFQQLAIYVCIEGVHSRLRILLKAAFRILSASASVFLPVHSHLLSGYQ